MPNQTKRREVKHTPGPWEVSGYLVTRAKGVKYAICNWRMPTALSEKEKEANARLIASAPALLNACKYAVAHLEGGIKEKMLIAIVRAGGRA